MKDLLHQLEDDGRRASKVAAFAAFSAVCCMVAAFAIVLVLGADNYVSVIETLEVASR